MFEDERSPYAVRLRKHYTNEQLTTFTGKKTKTMTCKNLIAEGSEITCGARLVWHEGLKEYANCDNSRCKNYHICACGKEFGFHVNRRKITV